MKRLLIAIFLLLPSLSWGATYYVRADGEVLTAAKASATSCSAAASALSMAEFNKTEFTAGDTVAFCTEGGDYESQMAPVSSGTSAARITYDGDIDGDGTYAKITGITGSDETGATVRLIDGYGEYTTIQHFELASSINGVYGLNDAGGIHSGLRILHNKIHDMTNRGIIMAGETVPKDPIANFYDGVEIGFNTIYACGNTTAHMDISMSYYSTNFNVHHNTLYGTETKGVDGIQMSYCGYGNIIESNTIYNHNKADSDGAGTDTAGEDGIDVKYSEYPTGTENFEGNRIVNNDIYGHTNQSAIYFQLGSKHLYVYGNKLHDNKYGIVMSGPTDSYTTQYADIYHNQIYGNSVNGIASISDFIGDVNIYNNTIYNNGSTNTAGANYAGISLQSGTNYVIKNNILANNRSIVALYKNQVHIAAAQVATTVLDYNLHYNSLGVVMNNYNGSYINWATLIGAPNSQEAHGIGNTDPQIMDATNGIFAVKPGSHVIRKGDPTYGKDIGVPYVEGQHLMTPNRLNTIMQ